MGGADPPGTRDRPAPVDHPDRAVPRRLASYRKLQPEAAWQARKSDPRAKAVYVAETKAALKSLKYHPTYRNGS